MSDDIKRQYVNYLFFKVDPAWRRLARDERERGKGEFEGVIKDWKSRAMIIPFTTVGTSQALSVDATRCPLTAPCGR